MQYTKMDLEKWKRGDLFRFYIDNMRIVMSLTVDIDITILLKYIKEKNLKFYPTMIWIVSKIINSHDEFKYSFNKEGELIKWAYISPYYADFHSEDENFTKLVTSYCEDLFVFHRNFMADKEKYQNLRNFDLKDIPLNTFDVTCLPWIKYQHFDLHVFDEGKYLAPVVSWGKYETINDKTLMPLTMNIHHAVADGFHLCRFFNEVQELINTLK